MFVCFLLWHDLGFFSKCFICSISFKFKALELNRKILDGAEDLKKPAAKEPTVPEGFKLQVEKRLQDRQAGKAPQEEEPKFKAQPLPKKILEGVVVSSGLPPLSVSGPSLSGLVLRVSPLFLLISPQGLPNKKVLLPTVPESPAFALKKRVHREPRVEEVRTQPKRQLSRRTRLALRPSTFCVQFPSGPTRCSFRPSR